MAGTCVANNSGQLSAAVRKYTKAVGSRSAALKAPPALHLLSSTSSSSVTQRDQRVTSQHESAVANLSRLLIRLSLCVFLDVLQLTLSTLIRHSGEIYLPFLRLKIDLCTTCYYFLQDRINFSLDKGNNNIHKDEEVQV